MYPWLEESQKMERRVASVERQGEAARAVVVERSYPTEIEDLWDAIVTPERLARWFLPVSGDLRSGGRYQLEGNAGGTIERCDPPRLLAVTWEFGDDIGWVNLELEQSGEGSTRLTLEHIARENEAFLEFWSQFGPGAVGVGWDMALVALALYLESGDEFVAPDNETWVETEEGAGLIRAVSSAWVTAAVAFGTDAEAAREAGRRTTAFYTGIDES